MNKKIKGYELMKLIAEGQIKEGQKFLYMKKCGISPIEIYWSGRNFIYCNSEKFVLRDEREIDFILGDFEILEDEEEIDIQSIEETEIKNDGFTEYFEYDNGGFTESGYSKNYSREDVQTRKSINQLIKAVKQLDKKINKEE